jgi:hypothetical protein
MLDVESYEELVRQVCHMERVASLRAHIERHRSTTPREPLTEEELERSAELLRELVAETERLGLYK